MRRAVQLIIGGGVLLSAAACGTAKNGEPAAQGTAPAAASSAQAAEAAAELSCEALGDVYSKNGDVYSKNMGPFAEALTKMVTDGADKQAAQQSLTKVLGPTLKEWLSPVAHHCS